MYHVKASVCSVDAFIRAYVHVYIVYIVCCVP